MGKGILRIKRLFVFTLVFSMLFSEPEVLRAAELSSSESVTESTNETHTESVASNNSDENNAALTVSEANEVSQPYAESDSANAAELSESDNEIAGDMSEVSVTGSGSLGQMLSEGITAKESQEVQNNGYNVFSIDVSGSKATVSYETRSDCTLMVCIYNESNTKLLASGKLEVSANSTDAPVTIDTGTIPDYFFIRGYLIDTDSLRPLSTEYSSPMYTQEMKEFLAKKTTDFASDKVVNLDNSDSNNFAVANSDTKVILENTGYNQVTSEDLTNQVYVFENADDNIKSLHVDDTFVYRVKADDILVVKVSQIAINGDKVTITGKQISLDDAFSYIKIDGSKNIENAQADTSNLSDGVRYNGLKSNEENTGSVEAAGFEGDISTGKSRSYEFDTGAFSGSVDLKLDASVKYYLTLNYQYVEVKLDWSIGAQAKMDLHAEQEFVLDDLSYEIYGIVLSVTPKLEIKADITATISAKVYGTIGASWDSDSGFRDLTTSPKLETEWKIEGDVYIGVSIDPSVAILDKHVANVTIEGKAGVDISGSMSSDAGDTDDVKHDCGSACISGEIDAVVNCTATVSVFDNKVFEKSCDPIQYKISDWYCSLKYGDFAFTTCPHKSYKVTVVVKDTDGKAVEGCSVSENGTVLAMTDSQGMAELYLNAGKYQLNFGKSGLEGNSKDIKITDEAKKIEVRLKAKNIISDEIASIKLDCGNGYTAFIASDGSLYMWGCNSYGQMGDGTKRNILTPKKVMAGIKFKQVSCGINYSAAIASDGSLYTCGDNYFGQLGNGVSKNDICEFKRIAPNIYFKIVSCGYFHTAAIASDGSLYTWGSNSQGALGDGTKINMLTPHKIMPGIIFKDVSVGENYTAAIASDGHLYTWGNNANGQLGDGTKTDTCIPQIIEPEIKFKSVSCVKDGETTAAIMSDDSLFTWGYNGYGQVGDGTTKNVLNPKTILPEVKIDEMKYGLQHAAVIATDGSVYYWGNNSFGECGNNFGFSSKIPVKDTESKIKFKKLSCGGSFTVLLGSDNQLYSCGNNGSGELGIGSEGGNSYDLVHVTIPTGISSEVENNNVASTAIEDMGFTRYVKPRDYSESTTPGIAAFTGLSADSLYNIYDLKSESANDALSGDNVLTVSQASADANGNLSIRYEQRESCTGDKVFAVGQYGPDIADAEITVPSMKYNGAEQVASPVVKYNGNALIEGTDYEVCGQYIAKNAGNYTLIVRGTGGYSGSKEVTYNISSSGVTPVPADDTTAVDLSTTDTVISPIKNYTYTGSPIEPVTTVKYKKTKLEEGVDYTVSYNNNIAAGTAAATISGINNYKGTASKTFMITARKLNQSSIEIFVPDAVLSGNHADLQVSVFDRSRDEYLLKGIDYEVEYSNDTGIGKGKAVISAKGNYYNIVTRRYNIYAAGTKLVGDLTFALGTDNSGYSGYMLQSVRTMTSVSYKYDGRAKRPTVTVTDAAGKPVDKKYYSVSYRNNKNAGHNACVSVKGRKDFKGSANMYFTIEPLSISSEVAFNTIADKTYTGSVIRPRPTVRYTATGKTLRLNRDYSAKYTGNVNAGAATITITGVGNYTGTASTTFNILKKDMKKVSVKNLKTQVYTGSQIRPAGYAVYCGRHMLKEGRDYTAAYGINTAKGKGTVTLTATDSGGMTGSVTKTFRIK